MKTVAWFSGGVSSFISIYLIKDQIDEIIYIDIDDQVITARERSGGMDEKKLIIKKAEELIALLDNCYDGDFVEEILSAICNNEYIDEEDILGIK